MIKIMFVCHGNICRSTMAEFVMKDIVKKNGLENNFLICSSATSTEEIGNDTHWGTKKILDDAVEDLMELQNDPDADPDQIVTMTTTVTTLQSTYNYLSDQMIAAEQELENGKAQLVEAKVTVGQLQTAIANKGALNDAEQEIMDADAMLKQAEEEYNIQKADAYAELEDARLELEEAERKVAEMEKPVWHVLDRESIEAYVD